MSHVTYLSAALLAFWGISWILGLFSSSSPCTGFHYRMCDIITALLTLPGQEKHIIIIEVLQHSLSGKWLGLGAAFSLRRLLFHCLPGLSQRSLGKWRHQTLLGSNGIPLFSPHRVGLKSKSPLIWILTKTEQWVAVCKAFSPIQSVGIIQGISIHMKIMHRASLLV